MGESIVENEYSDYYINKKIAYYEYLVEEIQNCISKIDTNIRFIRETVEDNKYNLESEYLSGEYYEKFVEYKDIWLMNLVDFKKEYSYDYKIQLDNGLKKAKTMLEYWNDKKWGRENYNG